MVDSAIPDARRQLGLLASLVAIALATLLVTLRQYAGEPPRGADAPADEFSEARAREVLARVLGPELPHPMGSVEGARVRERIVAELTALGLEPSVQEEWAWAGRSAFGLVRNVVARIPGDDPGRAVLLCSHYDSVRAGPGSADDGASVGVCLEAARALLASDPLPHDVIVLIDDGEEDGLLGARAFVDHHPWFEDVYAVVNLEARGSAGASLLFETGADNAWAIEAFHARARRPTGNSLAYRIYERMPNDTDMTVFKEAGVPGVNFAFIGEPTHYHTPLDTLESLDPRSYQHHGDNALAAVRGLAAVDPAALPSGDAVYFDVLGAKGISWTVGWSLVWSACSVLGLWACVAILLSRGWLTRRELGIGLLSPAAVALAIVLAARLVALFLGDAIGGPARWPAHPAAIWTAVLAGGVAGALAVSRLLQRAVGTWGAWIGGWGWMAHLGLAAAILIPDASYMLVLPAAAAAVAGLVATQLGGAARRHPGALATLPGFLVAVVVWMPIVYGVHLAAGLVSFLVLAGPLVVFALCAQSALAPGRGRTAGLSCLASAAVALVAVLVSHAQPRFTAQSPATLRLMYVEDADAGAAEWLVEADRPHTERVIGALDAEFGPAHHRAYGARSPYYFRAAPAEPSGLGPPEAHVLSIEEDGETRRVRVRLLSGRGAPMVGLKFEEGTPVRILRVQGSAPPESVTGGRPVSSWLCMALPPEGLVLELELESPSPLDAMLFDRSVGVPESARALLDARRPDCVPISTGDGTVVTRSIRL